ncbi:hypothetical protein [Synechococcus phage S-H25]|nr:hypothetical protein [Synechococcus phage S-H25]
MTINRSNPGDVEMTVSVYRDGKRLETSDGKYELKEYVKGLELFESITSSTLEARMIIDDAGGLLGIMSGSEVFKITLKGSVADRTYHMRSYSINSRSRVNQDSDVYIIDLASDEFIKNEAVNLFGKTDIVFNKQIESSAIIRKVLKDDKRFLSSKKNLYLEETITNHSFVMPNWRAFDVIYWLSERSIRKSQKGNTLQNGFAFFENALGYHFKSIDKLIEDINLQTTEKTNTNTGKVKLHHYELSAKNMDDGVKDQFRITSVVFPEEKNFLMGLRHGAWSGFSIGFDPVTISQSKMGLNSTDLSVDAYKYSLSTLWSKMNHLDGPGKTNPMTKMDKGIQNLINYPKRVRYTIMPNQIFDENKDNPQKNYEQLVELQAYQWMRIESLKTTKLKITIPGNLDLYAGYGIHVTIPSTVKSGSKPKADKKYTGRYLIASLTHSVVNGTLTTELLLMKDSTY